MGKFFIDRPIFAWVIAILVMLLGALCIMRLPVAQYPDIASPQVTITAQYPGASAKTIEDTVTQVIEQQMKGLDNLLYMYSTSSSSGQAEVNFAFEIGTDVDIAQVQVQNKLQLATPLLPQEVQTLGLTVAKSVKNFLLITGIISEDGSLEAGDLGDYLVSNVKDVIGRMQGVGDVTAFGSQYAMRIWLDPEKMEQYKLNPSDITGAIRDQNAQVTGGQVGAGPALKGQQINITVNAASRFETAEQFENVIIRTNPDGSHLLLKEVARIELNRELFDTTSTFNGKPMAGMAIKLASGANALDTIKRVKQELDDQSLFFPPGVKVVYPYDTAPFVTISITSVVRTLVEAIVLVFLIMYLFLQNFRATLIPTIAVPVVLLGTFAVMSFAGFSINSLTMFGMVLAIGLLVDDAIVVVENVERLMHEEGLSPRDAARKTMDQITGALVGVAMVIGAVFVPMAFMTGSTGVIFRQFSITIVTAMTLSVFVAIILTPALCATMLKPVHGGIQRGFFGWFNRWFERQTKRYEAQVGKVIVSPVRMLAGFALALVLVAFMFWRLPTGFLPNEDQGVIFATVQLPIGATFERTRDVLDQMDNYLLTQEKDSVESVMSVAGFSFAGKGQNSGLMFIRLKHWDERKSSDRRAPAIIGRAMGFAGRIPEAQVVLFPPPPVIELGNASGFDFEIVAKGGQSHDEIIQVRNELLQKAWASPVLTRVRPNGLENVQEYVLDINLEKAGALGLTKGVINSTIASYWGASYVNDFMDKGRTKKVYIQADPKYRMQPSDFDRFFVRNSLGEMVPFSSFMTMHSAMGAPKLERYLGVPSIEIIGEPAPGYSTGDAMAVMEQLGDEMPPGYGYDWTGLSLQEKRAGSQAPFLYAISLVVVFLSLAALYESWTVPLSVLIVVPTGVVGALAVMFLRGMYNDIYFQIGLLTIIGLSAKNSILIVEFAKSMHEGGMDLYSATREAAHLRLRPILMTSLCFILGVIPLALSSSAGAGGQNALGTAVVGGMLAATSLGIYYTPLFYVLITRLFSRKPKPVAAKRPEKGAQHV